MSEEETYYEEEIKPLHNPQKMSWSEVARFVDYDDAKKFQMAMGETDEPTKIRRRPKVYSVMQGSPLKKERAKKDEKEVSKKKRAPHPHDKKARKKAAREEDAS